MTRRTRVGPLLAVAVAAVLVAPAPAQAVDSECWNIGAEDARVRATGPAVPLGLLRIGEAHRLMGGPLGAGYGVTVAIVDSGISPDAGIPVLESRSFARQEEVLDPHGTVVAGLVAGAPRPNGALVGVAPAARLVDVRVYDTAYPTDPSRVGLEPGRVSAGLRWVARNAKRLDISVVVVPLAMPRNERVAAAIEAVQRARRRGLVVVAPTGNRPSEADPLFADFGSYRPGEDASAAVFPAGYDGVVGVNATAAGQPEASDESDVRAAVLQSLATDVAAPTYGGISMALNGSTCVVLNIETSLAAAEVGGVVAMLRARFPEEDADQIVRRLLGTASGRVDRPTPLLGAGVVQPVEALTRPLGPDAALVRPAGTADRPAVAPTRPRDVRADRRRHALWWGLLGGGALALSLVLRPVVGRAQRGRR